VRDHPNFQLAQLAYGDLLAAQARPVRTLGDVPDTTAMAARPCWPSCATSRRYACKALRERPPAGTIPSQFLALSPRTKHAIAVDASRSRLYLFENSATGLKLVADYYISVGKLGIEKTVEGDQRTPLGVYFITSNLDPKSLKDFYGAGALPINYPNPTGRSGAARPAAASGCTARPPTSFARAQGHRRLRGAGQPRPGAHHPHRGGAHHPGGDRAVAAVGRAPERAGRAARPLRTCCRPGAPPSPVAT
jgi:L,D-transpeptidase YnhG